MLHPHSEPRHPGRLTAAMRAARLPRTPKMLRVALVHDGCVVDERLLPADAEVIAGAAEDATFYVPGAPRTTLERRGESRGRMRLGDHTILFQLVDAPPKRAPAPLPMGVRRGLFGDIDWMTTLAAAASFLVHFLGVTLVYSDWADPVIDDELVLGALVVSVSEMPAVPPLESAQPIVADDSASAPSGSAAPQGPSPGKSSGQRGQGGRQPSGPASDAERIHDIAAQLAALDVATLTQLGPGTHTDAVFGSSDVPAAMLDDAARSANGVSESDPLRLGDRRSFGPSRTGRDLRSIGDDRAAVDAVADGEPGRGQAPTAPTTTTDPIGDPPPTRLPDAPQVIARLRARFRHCYEGATHQDPDLEGSVTLVVRVGPNGEVQRVTPSGGSNLAILVPCLVAVMQSAVFQPPGAEGAVLSVPIVFKRQR